MRRYDTAVRHTLGNVPTVSVAGIQIVACSGVDEASKELIALAVRRPLTGVTPGTVVRLANAGNISLFSAHSTYRTLFEESINLPDGLPLARIGSYISHSFKVTQVRGPSLFAETLSQGRPSVRHYLLGGSPSVLADLKRQIRKLYPEANVVGSESPPFRVLTAAEQDEQTRRILNVQPDIVWVGLGTPKQDYEASRLASLIPATFVCVGAAFDFVAGHKKQAPVALQAAGLEWAFRLVSEPRRLWRRYLFGNLRFATFIAPDVLRATLRRIGVDTRHLKLLKHGARRARRNGD